MATVTVQSKDGNTECVTLDTFKVWKKNNGARAAFVVKVSKQDDGAIIVDSLRAMRPLPDGDLMGERVEREKCHIGGPKLKKELGDFEMWRSV